MAGLIERRSKLP